MRETCMSGVSGGGRANGLGRSDPSTAAPPDPRGDMPRKPLRQEQVPRHPIDRRDRCVSNRMERVKPVEPRLPLPLAPRELDPALRYPPTALGTEEGILGM